MKYRAFNTFIHNGKRIKGGEVFSPEEYNFKQSDIDFLLSLSKIERVYKLEEVMKEIEEEKEEKPVTEEDIKESKVFVLNEKEVETEQEEVQEEAPEEEAKVVESLEDLKKAELVELAESLGIDTKGKTKKELLEELKSKEV